MIIREYRPEDLPAIDAIQIASQPDLNAKAPDGYFDDLKDIPNAFAEGRFAVAEIDGEVAGFGGLLATGEIVRMRVATQHRRKGVANAILTKLVTSAASLGMDKVHLHTLEEQSSAQALYLKFGFKQTRRGELNGNRVIGYELLVETQVL